MFTSTTFLPVTTDHSVTPVVIRPGQTGYDDTVPWNLAVPSRPKAVVRARSAAEIAAAVRYAADHGLRVAVRSTGHGAAPCRMKISDDAS